MLIYREALRLDWLHLIHTVHLCQRPSILVTESNVSPATPPPLQLNPQSVAFIYRAGKCTKFTYLSKSTSNSEKSYSIRSKSTENKLYLKYEYKVDNFKQKYFYRPKNIIAFARLQHVTISGCYILIRVEFLLAEFLPGAMTCKRHRPTIAKNNNDKKQIIKYWYFVTFSKVQLKCTSLQVKVLLRLYFVTTIK